MSSISYRAVGSDPEAAAYLHVCGAVSCSAAALLSRRGQNDHTRLFISEILLLSAERIRANVMHLSEIMTCDDVSFRQVLAQEADLILRARRDARAALQALSRVHAGEF